MRLTSRRLLIGEKTRRGYWNKRGTMLWVAIIPYLTEKIILLGAILLFSGILGVSQARAANASGSVAVLVFRVIYSLPAEPIVFPVLQGATKSCLAQATSFVAVENFPNDYELENRVGFYFPRSYFVSRFQPYVIANTALNFLAARCNLFLREQTTFKGQASISDAVIDTFDHSRAFPCIVEKNGCSGPILVGIPAFTKDWIVPNRVNDDPWSMAGVKFVAREADRTVRGNPQADGGNSKNASESGGPLFSREAKKQAFYFVVGCLIGAVIGWWPYNQKPRNFQRNYGEDQNG